MELDYSKPSDKDRANQRFPHNHSYPLSDRGIHYKNHHQKTSSSAEIVNWVVNFQQLPHCSTIKNIKDLKSGIALAQILSTKIPASKLRNDFLSQITISNVNQQTSLKNLKAVITTLKSMGMQRANAYIAQQLFNRNDKLVEFIMDFQLLIQSLQQHNQQYSTKATTKEVTAYNSAENRQKQHYNYPIGLQELSEIAIISSSQLLNSKSKQKIVSQKVVDQKGNYFRPELGTINCYVQPDLKDGQKVVTNMKLEHTQLSPHLIRSLSEWLQEQSRMKLNCSQPHQIFASLLNAVCSDRLHPEPVIKKMHLQLGSLAVWNKIGDYLAGVERLKKTNVLQLVREVQEEGIVRERLFWLLIKDIRQMLKGRPLTKTNFIDNASDKIKKHNRKINFDPQIYLIQSHPQKQNIVTNKDLDSIKHKELKVADSIITSTQQWLQSLGFGHSLIVSRRKKELKGDKAILQSPVLNGNLIAQLLMRLQIGKIILIKEPQSLKEVERNIQEVVRVSLGRGYVCVRNLVLYKGNYNQYIGVVAEIKSTHQGDKQKQRKISESIFLNKKYEENYKDFGQQVYEEDVIKWIMQQFQVSVQRNQQKVVSCQQLTHICSQLLKLNLYRQTTHKIQLQNMEKILDQLRRVGITRYYCERGEQYILPDQGAPKRWNVLLDLYRIFATNKQPCHK